MLGGGQIPKIKASALHFDFFLPWAEHKLLLTSE